MIEIKIKRLSPDFADIPLPAYQTEHSAGMDVRAAVERPLVLNPGQRRAIPTNLAMEIPPGYEAQIRPRSGLALKHGITLPNTPGTIDADYRGELLIITANTGKAPFTIERGDRIAQMIIAPVTHATIVETDTLSDTVRAEGGFGSTGKS